MSAVVKHWKEASTIILAARCRQPLTKASKQDSSPPDPNYKVLMLKRSGKSSFMANAFVFPGGAITNADYSRDWVDVFKSVASENLGKLAKELQGNGARPEMITRNNDSLVPNEIAFRICAIRETFEESGILLAREKGDMESLGNNGGEKWGSLCKVEETILEKWRKRVDADAEDFVTMCKELCIVPDVWSLGIWSNWLTPTGMPAKHKGRRFDTMFYVCCIDEELPAATHCERETVQSEWCVPSDMLRRYYKEELWLPPPQISEYSRLSYCPDLANLNRYVHARARAGCEQWLPVKAICNDGLLSLMPGDDLYPKEPDYIGDKPSITLNSTMEDNRHKTKNLNRFEIAGAYDIRVFCNIRDKHGHLPPVWAELAQKSKL